MKAIRLEGATAQGRDVDGRVLVHDLGPDLRKGTVLGGRHLDRVRQAREVHLVELEPGDLHEDEAARRLAAALVGPGLEAQPPVQSQARLIAQHRGLVRVRADLVDAINALGYISVFTLMDGQAVVEGEEVAGCKVTPVAVPGSLIEEAEKISREQGPVIELLTFRPLKTFVVATERLKPLGAELVLFAGPSAIDPLDPAYAELTRAGGLLLQLGAPMHPGSMLWLGRLGDAGVGGVACLG